ncbi:PIG-L deacetylase family protein [Humisphaera borealis]|uniref:PIG-L family deacetylase n=1 Tax=Humisphaera borealis TaxID=2807512 RepID=A0A7M2X0T3_9BACT|nr:PIG-L deacetylase family protein [Humisphaera borealis]QOV91279.1 PIG-L family deacetylase [Humisphaera borealis]
MLSLFDASRIKRLLCLGAHSDDIEIGAGGTLLRLLTENPAIEVRWVVFCGASDARRAEAAASADQFLAGCRTKTVEIHSFRDGYLPSQWDQVKDQFELIKKSFQPDLIFTQFRDDRHQDHRTISDLAYNTWRDHTVLEYEILKYDGDLGRPNVYSPISAEHCDRKVQLLMDCFGTQRSRQWFTEDTFRAMLRVRGVECNSPSKFAEAFHVRKLVI